MKSVQLFGADDSDAEKFAALTAKGDKLYVIVCGVDSGGTVRPVLVDANGKIVTTT